MKKRNRRSRLLVLGPILVFLVGFVGCGKSASLPIEEFGYLLDTISDRHDAYVTADPKLSDDQRGVYLRSTEILRAGIEAARESIEDPPQD